MDPSGQSASLNAMVEANNPHSKKRVREFSPASTSSKRSRKGIVGRPERLSDRSDHTDHDSGVPIHPSPEDLVNGDGQSHYSSTTRPVSVETESKSVPPQLLARSRTSTLQFRKQSKLRHVVEKIINAMKPFHYGQLTRQDNLCSACRKLHLSRSSFLIPKTGGNAATRSVPLQRVENVSLGTYREIFDRSRECPMCRLVVHTAVDRDGGRPLGTLRSLEGVSPSLLAARCEIKWQIDGRQKVGQNREVPRTRRLCIRWQDDAIEEAHVLLVHPNDVDGPEPPPFLGRLLTSTETSLVAQSQEWLGICSNTHSGQCDPDMNSESFRALRQESFFGMIDLDDMKLSALPAGEQYAVLSYTWGIQGTFKTTLTNVESLKRPGGLREVESRLPRTIRDTLSLVRKIGFRYLWIDGLCILQGDQASWNLHVDHIGTIYGHASLTVCAADGKDAEAGLVAFHTDEANDVTRAIKAAKQQVHFIRAGDESFKLVVAYPPEKYISRSFWNSRAWTFHERVLSKRCLIFVEGRVYFQCRTTTFAEDIYGEDPEAGWSMTMLQGSLQGYNNINEFPLEVYERNVPLYTTRSLSVSYDILSAFRAINEEICSNLGGIQVFGLPNSHFDLALLWEADTVAVHRKDQHGEINLPSWSWCGWTDARISYPAEYQEGLENDTNGWLMTHTWITWHIRDGRGNLRLVWDPLLYSERAAPLGTRWRGYGEGRYSLADRYRYWPDAGQRQHNGDVFHRTMLRYPFSVCMVPPGQHSKSTHGTHDTTLDDQRFLQFWTWSARFYLVNDEVNGTAPLGFETGIIRASIRDANGDLVGSIRLDVKWLADHALDHQHEFIAISEAKGFTQEEMGVWTYMEPGHRDAVEWYVYNVLLLEDDSAIDGVVRRVGLGKIYKRAFDTAIIWKPGGQSKEWKEIILG